jgi:hypothetical protein
MQGDDHSKIDSELEELDNLWKEIYSGEKEKPSVFSCYEEHLDYLLSQYSEIMT